MPTTANRTLFVGGLWFNPNTVNVLSRKLHLNKVATATLDMQHTLAERAESVLARISGAPEITQVIAHSAGCLPVARILDLIKSQVRTVVLLNPAPLPGVKFKPTDRLSKLTMKYVFQILRGKAILPTHEEMKTVLGYDLTAEAYGCLTKDSGRFLRELIKLQYFARQRPIIVPDGMKIVTYMPLSGNDMMLGSTLKQTIALWHGFKSYKALEAARNQMDSRGKHLRAHAVEYGGACSETHISPLQEFDNLLSNLRGSNGFTL